MSQPILHKLLSKSAPQQPLTTKPGYARIPQITEISTSHWSNNSTDALVNSKGPHFSAYIGNPWLAITYTQFLSFSVVILLFPLIFLGILAANNGVVAPHRISNFVSANPRLTPQITTIFSSFLTSCVKWALAGVVTIHAQKHFQHSRPIYKIEVFSALKNGAIAWSWKRRWLMFLTWAVMFLCGLLTSGFVALLSPFPIEKRLDIRTGWLAELDLAKDGSSCQDWYLGWEGDCPGTTRYGDSNFVYSTCPLYDIFGGVWDAAESSMKVRFSSQLPEHQTSALVHTFTQFANTRIIGSTAGTLPIGPAGVSVFPKSTFPAGLTTGAAYNYTLSLQGIWAEASCSYSDKSRVNGTYNSTFTTYRITCPSGYEGSSYTKVTFDIRHGAIIGGYCFDSSWQSDNLIFEFRSFWSNGDEDMSPDRVYAGINAVRCIFTPQVGLVDATYQNDLAAFRMIPSNSTFTPFSRMTELTRRIVIGALDTVLYSIHVSQTSQAGHPLGAIVSSFVAQYGQTNGQQQDPLVLDLLADALKGMFEFGVTNRRLIYTAMNGTQLDQSCLRDVEGQVVQGVIGWEIKLSTVLGLIPLLIISVACLGVTTWTMLRKDGLTVFDPTNPTSLIGAVSDGKLYFSDEKDVTLIGDPEDEVVLNTKVRYECEDGRWGLRRKSD